MSETLFGLTSEMIELDDKLALTEPGDEGRLALLDAALATQQKIEDKIDAYVALIGAAASRAQIRKAEADRLKALADTDARLEADLKARLLWWMDENNLTRIETPHYRVSKQANGGVEPVNISVDVTELPMEYRTSTVTWKADKKALLDALKSGEVIDGVSLGERGFRLAIK